MQLQGVLLQEVQFSQLHQQTTLKGMLSQGVQLSQLHQITQIQIGRCS